MKDRYFIIAFFVLMLSVLVMAFDNNFFPIEIWIVLGVGCVASLASFIGFVSDKKRDKE